MNRRDFTTLGLGAALAGLVTPAAHAQGTPVEGRDYVKLSQRQPVQDPKRIEVVEFFWYGCPHCNEFEPMLNAWLKKLPPDVVFRRVPVAFRDEPFGAHQRIFYALEAMGQLEPMHRKVFFAIHNERKRLDKPEEIADFMQKNGVDAAKFMDLYKSFSVQTKARQAKVLAETYKIDGVPAMGVNGQYYTSGSLAGSLDRALAVTDFLIQRSRKG